MGNFCRLTAGSREARIETETSFCLSFFLDQTDGILRVASEDDDILKQLALEYAEQMDEILNDLESAIVTLSKTGAVSLELQRNVHSMKGAGASFGIRVVSAICHQFEDHLTQVRDGQIPEQDVVDKFLKYVDLLREARRVTLDQGLNDAGRDDAYGLIQTQLAELQGSGLRKVLVADEVRSIRPLIEATFSSVKARVVFVDDGMIALTRCLFEKFDLLVVAGKLKTIDGAGVIAALKLSGRGDIPVCALLTSSGKERLGGVCGADAVVERTPEALIKLPALLNANEAKNG